jgi:hypothetical protein
VSSLSTYPADFGGRSRSALAATVRFRVRELLAVTVVWTLLGVAALHVVGVDIVGEAVAAHAPAAADDPVRGTLTYRIVEAEAAGAVGLLAATVSVLVFAERDHPEVDLRPGRPAFLLAGVAAVSGAMLGHAAGVDFVRWLVGSGAVLTDGVGGRYWLAELAVCLPVVTGVAFATPPTLVGAARARLVSRRLTSRERGVAVLGAVSFASVYSPPDSVTFVVTGGLLLAALAVGFALVEFDLA